MKASKHGGMNLTDSNYRIDRVWADQYFLAIESVVRKIANRIITFTIAPEQDDTKEATDYLITVDKGTIACRIRRPNCKYLLTHDKDFTLRAWRSKDMKTELAKIKEGFGQWYIYAWAKDRDSFEDWLLLDLNALRESPLLKSNRALIYNTDGTTAFVAFSLNELYLWNVIIEREQNALNLSMEATA